MYTDQKNLFKTKILKSIPKSIKPIEYLITTLDISKESAYRRLRGDIPFTFDEMAKLALDLDLSLDELIAKPGNSRVLVNMHTYPDEDLSGAFMKRFEQYYKYLLHLEDYSDVEVIFTLNSIPLIASVYFKNIFKFFYFKLLHKNNEIPLKLNYSDIIISDEMEELRKKVRYGSSNCTNKITLILDSNFLVSLMNEIRYFYRSRLINDEDFQTLKNEVLGFVDFLETSAQTGIFGQNSKMNIYLSSTNIEVNMAYLKYNGIESSLIYALSINPISITNPAMGERHRKWINSLKKYSTLISQSNELLQVEYFNKQREFINSQGNGNFLVPYF